MARDKFFPQDKFGVPLVIDHVHAMVHAGKHYVATFFETVGAGSSVTIMITAPNNTDSYDLVIELESNAAGAWYFYETPDATGGTAITSYNNNRNSSLTSDLTIVHTPTIATVGTTLLEQHIIGANSPGSNTGGSAQSWGEWELKTNTKYLFKFTGAAGVTCSTAINCFYLKN